MKIVLGVLGLILLAIGLGGAVLNAIVSGVAHAPGSGERLASGMRDTVLVAMVGAGLLGLALYLTITQQKKK